MFAALGITTLLLIIPLSILVRAFAVKIVSNNLFETEITTKESFIIVLKNYLGILALGIFFSIIMAFLPSTGTIGLILSIVATILLGLASAAIYGNLIQDNWGMEIGMLKGFAVELLSLILIGLVSGVIALLISVVGILL